MCVLVCYGQLQHRILAWESFAAANQIYCCDFSIDFLLDEQNPLIESIQKEDKSKSKVAKGAKKRLNLKLEHLL